MFYSVLIFNLTVNYSNLSKNIKITLHAVNVSANLKTYVQQALKIEPITFMTFLLQHI